MYSEIMSKLRDCIEKTNDTALVELVNDAQMNLTKEHKISVGLISEIYGKKTILKVVEDLCGTGFDVKNYIPDRKKFVLKVKSGEENNVAVNEYEGYTEIEYVKENYEGVDIVAYCGMAFDDIDAYELMDIDTVVLMTNATMALQRVEKDWVTKIIDSNYGGDRVIIAPYGLDLVTTQSDIEDIEKTCSVFVKNTNSLIRFFMETEAMEKAVLELKEKAETLCKNRKKYIVHYYLREVSEYIKRVMDANDKDLEEIHTNIKAVEKEKKELKLLGQIAVENKATNRYVNLKYQLLNACDQYSDDICDSILTRLENSDSFDEDCKHVTTYFEKAWMHFEENVEAKMVEAQKSIVDELFEQMESDCKKLVQLSGVPESAVPEFDNSIVRILNDEKMQDFEIRKENRKKLSRGMLVASVVITLFNPVVGIGTLLGTKAFEYVSKGNELKEKKDYVLNKVKEDCKETKRLVVEILTESIEELEKATKESMRKMYDSVIDSMVESLENYAEKVEEMKNKAALYEAVLKECDLNLE